MGKEFTSHLPKKDLSRGFYFQSYSEYYSDINQLVQEFWEIPLVKESLEIDDPEKGNNIMALCFGFRNSERLREVMNARIKEMPEMHDFKTSFFYPNQEYFDEKSNTTIIVLDKCENYPELVSKLDSISCTDSTPVVRYQNTKSTFNLIPSHPCPTDAITHYYRERNGIRIVQDSIYARFKPYDIDSLSHIVKRHLTNRGKELRFSDSPDHAFFSIEQHKSMTLDRLEELLIIISESFNEVNKDEGGGLKLYIHIAEPPIIPIPPPPPLNKE
jgi:hypothetical protein